MIEYVATAWGKSDFLLILIVGDVLKRIGLSREDVKNYSTN
jgi:hypothetical protein